MVVQIVLEQGRRAKSRPAPRFIEPKDAPLLLLGLDSHNGTEPINQHLYAYRQREGITFTRSRPYKKNDSCHAEQKNWSVVRRFMGYDRYSSRAALEAVNGLYDLLHLHVDFFQPVMKLESKTRHGSKVHKRSMIKHGHPISGYSRLE